MIELAASLGIGHKVLFTGFLRGKDDVERGLQMADCYVMPSVSEPFGIAPLEASRHDVPVIISKQSGVSEVLTQARPQGRLLGHRRDGQQDRRRPAPPAASPHPSRVTRLRRGSVFPLALLGIIRATTAFRVGDKPFLAGVAALLSGTVMLLWIFPILQEVWMR
jgi:hypothetical protein